MTGVHEPAVAEALVSPAWLRKRLADPDLRLLHVTNDPAEYDAGHLPGALQVGGYADLTEDRDGVRALVPLPGTMAATLSRLGVGPQHRVVVYAGMKSPWPARAYWVLRYYRFPRVHLVDGALPALVAAGLPRTAEPAAPLPLAVELAAPDDTILATVEEVLAAAQRGGETVLDCRTDDEWHGLAPGHAPQPRLGRIPRAVHLNWEQLVDVEGRFLPLGQLRSLYAAAGVDGRRPVYPYCGGGVRSTVAWFALHELLGYELAANYDGS